MKKNKSHLNRREFITLSALGILSGFNCIKSRSNTKPNLIFVFADQFRRHAMGFMNEDPVITPNFNKFAKESLVFTNAVSSVAICSPFRAMLMTGRFPKSTGIVGNCKTGIDFELKEDEVCFGDVLNRQGYRTAYIGKWHLECPSHNKIKRPPDWAHPGDAWTPPGPRRHGFQFWYAYNSSDMHFNPHFWSDKILPKYVNEWSVKHETGVAIDYIERNKDKQPFSVFLSWGPPHPPHFAPEKYVKMYKGITLPLRPNALEKEERLNYYAQITACDHEFGRLINYLDNSGLTENTIVVFTADHGEMMGSHGRMQKDIWYEEAIGIPFLIRWPEKIRSRRTDMLFAVYDFMPTLLGLMELPVPNTVQGKDYSETLLDHTNEEPSSAFLGHYSLPVREHYLSVGTRPNKSVSFALSVENAGIDPSQWGYRGIRTKRYTYIVDRTPEGIEGFSFNDELDKPYKGSTRIRTTRLLYDNVEDPYQQRPIIASIAEENKVMKELEIELRMWLNKMNDPFPLED